MSATVELLERRLLLAAGDLDPSFGVGGKVTTDFGTPAQGESVAIQSDGKIVVVGQANNDFALARYNSDGSLDTSFDGDGKVTSDFGLGGERAFSIVVQADGKIVVAGFAALGGNGDFALARYNSDGSLDTSFDGDGKLTTAFGTGTDFARSVVLQADGKIVVAGFSAVSGEPPDFALARYNSDGSLDTSFDGDGKLTTTFAASADSAFCMELQADGKIVVAGEAGSNNGDFALARYNSDGSLDTSFDGDGKLTTDFGASADDVNSMALQTDGKIIVAGSSTNGGNQDFALARYNSDGSLDTSFDGDGKLTTDFGTSGDSARSVVLQSNGKFIVTGYTNPIGGPIFALARYNNDGSLDSLFDGDGKLTTDFTTLTTGDYANSVALQTDSKIIVAGASNDDFALARYFSNGAPTITSPNAISVQENTTAIQTVTATDPENDTLSYSFAGGADVALFAINSTTGLLSFRSAPNFEQPTDSDLNNIYSVTVQVSDGTNVVTQDIQVTVTNINESPQISDIPNVSMNEDGVPARLIFTVGDAETAAANLTVTATSSDTTLLPNGNITLENGGEIRTIRLTPAANQWGMTTITVTVSDGSTSSNDTFALTVNPVNDLPTIGKEPILRLAIVGQPFTLSYESLLTALDAGDIDGDTIQLRVEAVYNGLLTKNGIPVSSGITSIGPNESLVWTLTPTANAALAAFRLRAFDPFDGFGSLNTAVVTIEVATIARYLRSYNPETDHHFFTMSQFEFDNAVTALGFRDENTGRPGFAVATGPAPGATPIYRLYNTNNNRHYYTVDTNEKNVLVGQFRYRDEGVQGYVWPAFRVVPNTSTPDPGDFMRVTISSGPPGTTTIFRLYNFNSGSHLLVESVAQKDAILAMFPGIWVRHADFGFAFPVSAGSVPGQASALSNAVRVARASAGDEFDESAPTTLDARSSWGLSVDRVTTLLHESLAQPVSSTTPTSPVQSIPISTVGSSQNGGHDRAIRRDAPPRTIADELSVDQFWEQLSHGSESALERLFGSPA